MHSPNPSSSNTEHRVVSIRRGRRPAAADAPVEDLKRYQGGVEDAADYRHRMIVNAAAFLFVVALIGGAIWLADTMAAQRRGQDCVLSGRQGCSPVEVNRDRW